MASCQRTRLAGFICLKPLQRPDRSRIQAPKDSEVEREPAIVKQSKARKNKRRQVTTSHFSVENTLLKLCRSKDWSSAIVRCKASPEEATIVRLPDEGAGKRSQSLSAERRCQQNVYRETPLGLACASKEVATPNFVNVISALISACPSQLRASQLVPGHTPLRDAILNPHCTTTALKILLDADEVCQTESQFAEPAAYQEDQNGLLPIDHLVMALHLRPSRQTICMVKEFFRREARTVSRPQSPLIKLLTVGSSPNLNCVEPFGSTRQYHEDVDKRLAYMVEVTQFLLKKYPDIVHECSCITGCSPIHVALRNFGNCNQLISLLLSTKASQTLMMKRNNYGDLPLHVAASVGVPFDVLKMIVERTVAASRSLSDNCGPEVNTAVWSVNESGYTPVDLEWVRHIEAGMDFHTARSFYPLEPSGIRRHCFKQDEYYRELLREAVDEAVQGAKPSGSSAATCAKGIFGSLFDRISLLVTAAASATPGISSPVFLHHACKLFTLYDCALPVPLMELFLWVHRDQLLTKDDYGKVPLHYLVGSGYMGRSPEGREDLSEWKSFTVKVLQEEPKSSRVKDHSGRTPLHTILDHGGIFGTKFEKDGQRHREQVVGELIRTYPEGIDERDPVTRLDPFLLAAQDRHLPLDTVFRLLRSSPSRALASGS